MNRSVRATLISAIAVLTAVVATTVAPAPAQAALATAEPCLTELPDEAAAAAMAKRCDAKVEVLAGRSEFTQVFANPDGTSTFTSSVEPARIRRGNGWVPVDPSLRQRPDGSLAPAAALVDVAFSGGGSGPFATYRDGGSVLTLGLPVELPKPKIEGSSAVYRDILAGVDLRVTASATSFRHVLVVKTKAAALNPAVADIHLVVGGDVVAKPTGDGRVRFADKAGRTVALTQTASMWDSSINPGSDGQVTPAATREKLDSMRVSPPKELVSTEHGPGATSRSAPVRVRAEGNGRGLALAPDAAMLRGTDAVLPLFIDPSIGPTNSAWAYSRSYNANYSMDGKAWVGANPSCCGGDGTLFRAFFDFPTTYNGLTYKGKQILGASFSVELTHSFSCYATMVSAFRTDGIYVGNGARMDWGARPLGYNVPHLGDAWGNANEAGGCGYIQPNQLLTFGGNAAMANDVQAVANAYWDTYTIGICACEWNGANESAQDRWKKFFVNGNTTMSVTYNTVPGVPDVLSPHQGQVGCGGIVGTSSPVLQARYADEDGADTLSASFKWQQLPSGGVTTVAGPSKPANNNGSITLNLGSGAEGKLYQFQVQTHDGNASSPWSPWCTFTVDTTAPPAPIVTAVASGTSPVYPSCNPANVGACTPLGGPGIAGAFTFSEPAGAAGQDVVRYVYGWDTPGADSYTVSAGAATPPILYTPPRYGLNKLTAYSVDGTGRSSPTTNYYFLVNAPSAALAHWPLDTIDGHGLVDQVSGSSLTTTGVTWTPDVRYVGAQATTFANGAATQAVSTFNTAGSFSVSAWVRLQSTTCGGNQTAVAVDADSVVANNHVSAFFLGYDCANQRWRMRVSDRDIATPNIAEAVSANGSAVAGVWTFLVGVFQEDPARVRLYVDGVSVQATAPSAAFLAARNGGWQATGPVTLGRDRFNNTDGGRFNGEIADVRLWNRVVGTDDINGTDANPANGVPATDGLLSPRQVGGWRFPDGECFCVDTPDSGPFARKLTLVPNWSLDPNWNGDPLTTPAWLTADSHDGDGGVQLDGTSGHLSSADDMGTLSPADDVARPVLRTDQSVTMAAWAKLDEITNADQVVVSQGPMNLFFRGWEHKWGATLTGVPNGSGGTMNLEARSNVVATPGQWVHLVAVFDASTRQVRLYVNGALQTVVANGALASNSTTNLRVGAKGSGFSFGGAIDGVRVYQGVLNAREITALYATG